MNPAPIKTEAFHAFTFATTSSKGISGSIFNILRYPRIISTVPITKNQILDLTVLAPKGFIYIKPLIPIRIRRDTVTIAILLLSLHLLLE